MKALSIQANKLWFTSDQHFHHGRIISICERPYANIKDMHNQLIDNFNSVVGERDETFHLGDFSFSKNVHDIIDIFNQLNGRHHVLMGNHDHWWGKVDDIKTVQINNKRKIANSKITLHEPILKIKYQKQIIVLCHYALAVWEKKHWGSWCLCGHSHGNYTPEYGKILDVGVDSINAGGAPYFPRSFEFIKEYMNNRRSFKDD